MNKTRRKPQAMPRTKTDSARRTELVREITQLSKSAIFGSLAESYRTCGTPGCRCHSGGPKHGPHLFVSWRGDGKTRANYVPKAAESEVREGVAAWWAMQERLREVADMNKQDVFERARSKGKTTK